MKREEFDGFTVNVMLDDEGEWLAHFVELPHISAFAETPDAAVEELRSAWELVKESFDAAGEPLPVAPAQGK